jgi:serine phosphatase RsbU (regulator of sigma subunit)
VQVENLSPADLVARLNAQVSRHAPATRFITLFFASYHPATGELTFVNAGHTPALLIRSDGSCERLDAGGIALGMFDQSAYATGRVTIQTGEIVAVYSDGITEAENRSGRPFDESGLEMTLRAHRQEPVGAIAAAVVDAVERHTAETRFADDLTILLLRRRNTSAAGSV